MLPSLARTYLVSALAGTPDVLEGFLGGLDAHDERWDVRPDPERFTLREIVAHLAFVEPNWRERVTRTRGGAQPFFPRVVRQSAAHEQRAPAENLASFRGSRRQLVEALESLAETDWERSADWELLGPVTLEQQAVFVCVHDGYHVGQVAQWLAHEALR